MSLIENIEWPREIWAAERGEHDVDGRHVFSEHATVPRWEGDRDGEFHRYVDADIHDSAERYYREIIAAQRTWLAACRKWITDEWDARGDADREYPEERQCATILGKMP